MSHCNENDVEMQVTSNIQVSRVEVISCDESSSGGEKHKGVPTKKRKRQYMPKKEGKKKSVVWDFFDKFTDDKDNKKSKCKHCGKEYATDTSSNGTSAMLKHIRVCPKNPDNFNKQKIMFQKKENDGEVASGTLKTWKFDQDQVRKALVKMIVLDELPFSFVEKEGFREFMEVSCPSFHIPSRYTISRDCAQLFLDEKFKLKSFFKNSKQRVCLTTDTWTSIQTMNYMCLTAHFIDDAWILHKRIINFCPIFSHKGEEIGRAVEKCLLDWGIENVMTITVDNASSNDVAISYLRRRLENNVLDGKFLHMRCVAHIINLVVKDGLKEHDDSIIRVRAAVRYVRQSPARLEKFKDCVKECGIDCGYLLCLDCPTRWNSTFEMLETSQKFEKAFNLFEIRDPTYKHELEESCGVPIRSDWQKVRKFANFLEVFYRLTNNISGSLYVTANQFFHEVIDVDLKLRDWATNPDIGSRLMALKMREKYDKYWGNFEKMNMLLYIAVVLDPRHKLEFLEFSFENLYKKENIGESEENSQRGDCLWKRMFELVRITTFNLFNEYKGKFGVPQQISKPQIHSCAPNVSNTKSQMMELFKMHKLGGGGNIESKTELDRYLNEECDDDVDGFDILLWWKNNSARFPILSQMAKDVLAIPISTVASESAFSMGGRVLDSFRSSLSPPIVEALICTQDWVRKSRHQINLKEDLTNLDNLAKDICIQLQGNQPSCGTTIDGASGGVTSGCGTSSFS